MLRAMFSPACLLFVSIASLGAAAAVAGELSELPACLTIKQRTTAMVPGSDGNLQLTLDDITRGQVIVSLSHQKHGVLIGPTSMRPGDRKPFELGATTYQLRFKKLNNALIGDDFGEFLIALPPPELTEQEKITDLIAAIEKSGQAKVVRRGKEYPAEEEAAFLRKRAEAWNDKVATAEAFIDRVNDRFSDDSGPYRLRLENGIELPMTIVMRSRLEAVADGDEPPLVTPAAAAKEPSKPATP